MARQNTFLDPRGKLLVAGEQEEKKHHWKTKKEKKYKRLETEKFAKNFGAIKTHSVA